MKSKLLKELCHKDKCGIYGIPAKAEDFDVNKTRYLRITDISEDGKLINENKKSVTSKDIEKYILVEGDLVFARTGNSTGKTYYHEAKNGKLAFAGFLIKYSLDPNLVNPKYLRYYTITKHYKEWVEHFSLGSTRGNINAQSFGECPIPIPDRDQQDFLVKVLSDLDAKIELNNKINAELEAMAKLIYDYWFVQFEFPVCNEDGTLSAAEGYKSSGGKMVWNEELKREVPESWEVKKVKDFAQTGSGGTPLKSKLEYFENGNIPWINSGEVNASFIVKAEKFISEKGLKNSSAKMFKKGTILMAMYGATAGQVSLMDIEACTNQAICGINPQDIRMTAYLKFGLEDLYNYLISLSSGSARDNLSQDKIKELQFVIPDNNIIFEFDTQANAMLRKILVNMKENQKLAELRDWLLPMLMNGQVKVEN